MSSMPSSKGMSPSGLSICGRSSAMGGNLPGLPRVEVDRPRADAIDAEDVATVAGPRILGEELARRSLVGGAHDQERPGLVVERPAEDDRALVEQAVHELGVLVPERLLARASLRDPL